MTDIKLKRTNPYSGQSIALTLQEAKLHDQIKQELLDVMVMAMEIFVH